MKVEYVNTEIKTFEDIKIGDCFRFNDEIYIKTHVSDCLRNAFSFTLNESRSFIYNAEVMTVKAKVVIEEWKLKIRELREKK